MATGLLALLDDVASLAKVAAASLDDVAAHAGKASAKAAGIVIDDAAVTPRYVVGFAASRELPIIGKIALGSLKNKLVFLLPAALLLSAFAPWAITPLLMAGGLFLCFEGAEKVLEALGLIHHADAVAAADGVVDAATFEKEKVAGAIATDFILSAEIMAITLSTVTEASMWTQGAVLAFVGLALTVVVYGAVAIIVKADDVGVAMARETNGGLTRAIGRGLVKGMPVLLKVLSVVGTAAMVWVGGGIILHGLEHYGVTLFAGPIHALEAAMTGLLGAMGGLTAWLAHALASGGVGLMLGALIVPVVGLFHKPAA